MPQYNDMFELSVEDVDLIELALRRTADDLSQEQVNLSTEDGIGQADTLRRIQELLGRLHDQKIFYRPKGSVYIGG